LEDIIKFDQKLIAKIDHFDMVFKKQILMFRMSNFNSQRLVTEHFELNIGNQAIYFVEGILSYFSCH